MAKHCDWLCTANEPMKLCLTKLKFIKLTHCQVLEEELFIDRVRNRLKVSSPRETSPQTE